MQIQNVQIPNWINDIILNKKYRIIKHLLFWLFVYADEILSEFGITDPLESEFYLIMLEMLGDMIAVYFNIYYLLPKFLLKGKVIAYLGFTLISIIVLIGVNFLLYDIEGLSWLSISLTVMVVNTGILSMAVAIKLMEEAYVSSVKIQELKEDNLKTELAYLKTQVNPHFLFNTLNNMYVMSKKQQTKLPETIMQLSDLLRYQLYETEGDFVPLKNEVEYLKNYLELERLRRQHLNVEFITEGDVNMQKIRPLILLPFVENAFKYSNSGTGSDYIKIQIEALENEIMVYVENSKGSLHYKNVGGIGLTNARRRLELAYPRTHQLSIDDSDDSFKVTIKLQEND